MGIFSAVFPSVFLILYFSYGKMYNKNKCTDVKLKIYTAYLYFIEADTVVFVTGLVRDTF